MNKIAIDVIKAKLLALGLPIPKLTIDNVGGTTIELDPIKSLERIGNIFFFFQIFISRFKEVIIKFELF